MIEEIACVFATQAGTLNFNSLYENVSTRAK